MFKQLSNLIISSRSRSLLGLYSTSSIRKTSLFVANIPWKATRGEIMDHFGLNHDDDLFMPYDHLSRPRGFAFVRIEPSKVEEYLNKYNKSVLIGRELLVKIADSQKEARTENVEPNNSNQIDVANNANTN